MIGSKRVVCIIPARLESTRFPRKMLVTIKDKPLLQWVWEAAQRVSLFDLVVFAVDSSETASLIEKFGGRSFMTSLSCPSGTDRLVELQNRGLVEGDIWVNWQGDEPLIHEALIHDLLQTSLTESSDVWSLCKKIDRVEEISTPHVAKVIRDAQGFALYFSRSVIPHYRDLRPEDEKVYYKHVGLYAFTTEALQKIHKLSSCHVEEAEQLEQLRFLYYGLRMRLHETVHDVFGIDLPEHLTRVESLLSKSHS
jgi:3-deoxy-manno-octulosonate cytidylyltransferase (CMP-KDO synthetase)